MAQPQPVGAIAEVRDGAGQLVATGEFREGRGEVLITLGFASPTLLSGSHAVHIQEVGLCEVPGFASAGGDFNPYSKRHGRQNPDGPHVGDLPNVNFTSGLTTYNTSAPGATLGAGQGSLLGPRRTALVIYSGEDDQLTDPDGNSGARLACGVIVAAPGPGAVAAPKPVAPQPVAGPSAVTGPVPAQSAPGQGVAAQAAPPAAAGQPAPAQAAPAQAAPPSAAAQAGQAGPPSAAAQPVPGQAAPAQPPSSPVAAPSAVPKPVSSPVPGVAAAASPIPIVAVAPATPPPAQPTTSLGTGPALIIAILGVGLIAAGYLLRQRSHFR